MKRTRLKRRSSTDIAVLKRNLWEIFAKYVKARDNYTCYTCGKKVWGYEANAGHFIPKSVGGIALYFHPDNVHCQCTYCNLTLSGNQYVYGKRLGEDKVRELQALKNAAPRKWAKAKFEERIDYYRGLLSTGRGQRALYDV